MEVATRLEALSRTLDGRHQRRQAGSSRGREAQRGRNGRLAVLAIYSVLNVYKMSLALGVYKALMCTCLYENKTFQRAIERVFDTKPTAVWYVAESK
jgi:hypothetical protein